MPRIKLLVSSLFIFSIFFSFSQCLDSTNQKGYFDTNSVSGIWVSVFSEKGDLIYTKQQDIADVSRKTYIDLVNQVPGTYIVILESKTVRKTFKVIRE